MTRKPRTDQRNSIRWKLDRIRDGKAPRVVDLFAGCGGISLGTQLAGFEMVGSVEFDAHAAKSNALNFHPEAGSDLHEVHARARDITETDPHDFVREVRPACTDPQKEVDILVGGPPCQAFARVGRAKLREINAHPDAFLHDARSGLYQHYLKFVEKLSPVAVIVENVPDVLNYGGLNVFEIMAGALEKAGYKCRYSLLNASHYGVPQMRTRCFLVGIHQLADTTPSLPAPSHHHDLPAGYHGTRSVALKNLNLFENSHFIEAQLPVKKLKNAVTAEDALSDLPVKTAHLTVSPKKIPQRLNDKVKLTVAPSNEFAKLMRNWPGFESDGHVYDHAIRSLPRDYKLFKAMQGGDQYPEAHAIATRMFEVALVEVERDRGTPLRRNSSRFRELLAHYVPPYDPGKFPNKWRKLEANQPSRTLMAHLGKDSYSHIHYDSRQARTISVREAARLQSFPDGFRFSGTMNPAFRQIGNAVPPLLAHAVSACLLSELLGQGSTLANDLKAQKRKTKESRLESVPSGC